MSWLFAPGGRRIGASTSVPPVNIQYWFPLRLIRLISLQSKRLSRFSPSTTVWQYQFFGLRLRNGKGLLRLSRRTVVKNLSANAEDTGDQVRSLGREDPLEKEMATHSSILAWEIPWAEEPGGLQTIGLQRFRNDWAAEYTHTLIHQRVTNVPH